MKTNLIFRKQIVDEGTTKIVHRVVPVTLPDVDFTGWQLIGHTDSIEVFPVANDPSPTPKNTELKKTVTALEKFTSNIKGTAKLVRSDGVIKIVARKGKTTYNQTTPNSVCISDLAKEEFFTDCRRCYGSEGTLFKFDLNDGWFYHKWNTYIDNEYIRQRTDYIKRTSGEIHG